MSKPSSARYRRTNGSSDTAALRRRGALLIWLDKDMTWLAPHDGSPGRPSVFADAAIQFCLTIKVLFKPVAIVAPLVRATMATRQTTGRVAGLLKLANPGLGGAGRYDPVPPAEDTDGPDPLSARRRSAEPAG